MSDQRRGDLRDPLVSGSALLILSFVWCMGGANGWPTWVGAIVAVLFIGAGVVRRLSGQPAVAAAPTPKVAAPPAPPPATTTTPIPFEELRAKYARPAVALFRQYPPHRGPVGRSRFGGLPDLPSGVKWPRSFAREQGRELPLHFLAQIDLSELPWRPDGFPTSGTLLFFARVDETMDWDNNPVSVVFDRASAGVRTSPPGDLLPLEDGHHSFDRTFQSDGEPGLRVYPSWPLVPTAIETMPDGNAFVMNAYHHPAYAQYHQGLYAYRAEQATRASGRAVANRDARLLPIWDATDRNRMVLRPAAESGFPWAAEAVVLVARALKKGASKHLDHAATSLVQQWRSEAEALAPSAAWPPDRSAALVDLLNRSIAAAADRYGRDAITRAVDAAMYEVVVRTGGDPALAAAIPDAIYDALGAAHAPIIRSRRFEPDEVGGAVRWGRDDHQRVQYHQMFGHVPSTQDPMPVDSQQVCLLQLQSDDGADLLLCDLGEADFWLDRADLATLRFDKVMGETRGG